MTIAIGTGLYGVSLAEDGAAVRAAQALRQRCFFGSDGLDVEEIDDWCQHWLIGGAAGPVATFRTQVFGSGADLGTSYAAARYDLRPMARMAGPMIELGRFCIAPGARDGDVLRLAWAALARLVEESGARCLFGCASFAGTDPARHEAALRLLANRHLGPEELRPGRASGETVSLRAGPVEVRAAMAQLPGLLRSYLGMGGWVSDHAVIDRDLGTLHVFTALPVAAIPPRRAAALHAIAGLEERSASA